MKSLKKTILALTPGDPEGIGPEIVWKAIRTGGFQEKGIEILCIGAKRPFEKLGAPIMEWDSELDWAKKKKRKGPFIYLLPAPEKTPQSDLLLEGFQSGWSIQKATELIKKGIASALVTGPISKDRLQRGGFLYPGHTEFLADLCPPPSLEMSQKALKYPTPEKTPKATPDVTMMLANSLLRVSLVTTHLGIKDVSLALTREKIRRAVRHTTEGLQQFWGIRKPRIAVAALNPHAGESGRFGREEIDIIQPEILYLKQYYTDQLEIDGPFPADTLFALHLLSSKKKRWDAVVCMYHDQGLIPVKLLDFHRTVNVTLGLPLVRTSVDHGVGFDIAGKGIADASSLMAAIELAAHIVKKRQTK